MRLFFFILLLVLCFNASGQKSDGIIGLQVGYSATNIVIKEAFEPSVSLFGNKFNTGKTFSGAGVEFGVSKKINNRFYLDLLFSTFSGHDTKVKINNNKNYYNLSGFQIPLTVNYLLRNSSKRLRINLGAGVQYQEGHLQQFEESSENNLQITGQISNIRTSDFQFVAKPGIEFRIIPNLYLTWMIRIAISMNGRYTDAPCLSIKYMFRQRN